MSIGRQANSCTVAPAETPVRFRFASVSLQGHDPLCGAVMTGSPPHRDAPEKPVEPASGKGNVSQPDLEPIPEKLAYSVAQNGTSVQKKYNIPGFLMFGPEIMNLGQPSALRQGRRQDKGPKMRSPIIQCRLEADFQRVACLVRRNNGIDKSARSSVFRV